jgi:hypothetical protein
VLPKKRSPGSASDETAGQEQLERLRHYHIPIDLQAFLIALAPLWLAVILMLYAAAAR